MMRIDIEKNKRKGISVIIPIYNSEKYIDSCIQSLLKQTVLPDEIILVDDGSTDMSSQICDQYAEECNFIKAVHQTNKGQMGARRKGVEIAQNDWIMFADADDIIGERLIEKLSSYIEEDIELITSDLIVSDEEGTCLFYLSDKFESGLYLKEAVSSLIIPQMMFSYEANEQGIVASACAKLFKRDILLDVSNMIDFRIRLGEDGALVYSYLMRVNNVIITHIDEYKYVQHNNSMIRNYSLDVYEGLFRLKQQLLRTTYDGSTKMYDQIQKYVGGFFCTLSKNIFDFPIDMFAYYNEDFFIMQDKRVAVYGAGNVGCQLINRIASENRISLATWVDKYKSGSFWNGWMIESPDVLKEKQEYFDYIVIANSNDEVRKNIRKQLVNLGFYDDKILEFGDKKTPYL